ncbi:dihydroneopterin aldolase [Candidatus Peregrinibacteria bacterium CG10_big_fil_rev_8_21_14_0_10_49_24]|nr:MAG: dihydroneopterin aldolase [Candidatus Peregrinibacteria bacterium CG11_big_fil_rev_8_21_14_0_20_49_14]PIR51641.1 MAG: dihydroneopterin aldolase [Candidatus Peregrinibacteria bacterium CG10_big_fil_rev_8_21_14_0_10_49_24]PJA67999.1 MAG: dihydroneopterin aldolase [Candidatus Peregrinibacteria bacterium CG_4_9_14_3_um_filter_49_12]
MSDIICIQGLEVQTRIGVPDEERKATQRVLVTVQMHTDTKQAGESDAIADSIDYDLVAAMIAEEATKERKTLERFAEDIASRILAEFAPTSVSVSIQKFIVPNTQAVSVSIVRP